MKRPTITLEKWTQTADTVWLDSRTSAVVTTIDRNGQVTRANHSADCANARAIAALPALLTALEALHAIGKDGVAMRHETGKPTWSALEETKKLTQAALIEAGYTF